MRKAVMLLLAALLPIAAIAGDATVSWTNPTQDTNGVTLPAGYLTGTRVEYGTCSGAAFGTKAGEKVAPAGAVSTVITGLTNGATYCFRAFALAGSVESAASNIASKVIPPSVPNPPVLVSVVTTAWDLRDGKPNRVVGTLPLGTPCGSKVWKGYYEVARANVALERRPRSTRLVTKCGIT